MISSGVFAPTSTVLGKSSTKVANNLFFSYNALEISALLCRPKISGGSSLGMFSVIKLT